jgi:hypothetical protein
MKINLYNSAKSYSVTLCNENDGIYDAPAPFEDINAALAYCKEEIDVRQQAISAVIWDTDTGEVFVTCGFDEDNIAEEDYPSWDEDFGWDVGCAVEDGPQDIEWDDHYWDDGCPNDDVDESNYDPYAGCDMYEVEPLDYGY